MLTDYNEVILVEEVMTDSDSGSDSVGTDIILLADTWDRFETDYESSSNFMIDLLLFLDLINVNTSSQPLFKSF